MGVHNDVVSGGISSIPRSDLKIGEEKLKSGERQDSCQISQVNNPIPIFGHVSKDIDKTNVMSQVSKGTDIKSNAKPSSSKLNDLKRDLVKRNEAESRLDLNKVANDDSSSVCSSNDPMKMWEAMKQNGFLSKPTSSYLVSSTHGGIPAPRKRGRKTKNGSNSSSDATMMMTKKRKVEIGRKEEVDRFAKLAAPSGLLNQLNPSIINHVRNKKQVLSIIKNVVKSVQDAEINEEISEEMNTVGSRFSENVSSLSSEDTTDMNSSVLTVKAANVASQWLELLHQDIKGRVSALRRSKKRVRAVVTTDLPFLVSKDDQENDPNGASKGDIHKIRWIALFNQLEQTLSEEERQLENWLNQVRELQSHCDRGLQSLSSDQNFLQSRGVDALNSDKDLTVRAAAASIYSTCSFLAPKEKNLTCT